MTSAVQPDAGSEPARIAALDVLRGVGVLGILLLNIQSFAMPSIAYVHPTTFGDLTGANGVVWHATHLLGDQKFMGIFAMLFGAGVVLMTGRAEARGAQSARLHYRRMGWLLLFGVLHAYLLWYGDILFTYGVCGLGVYLLRHQPPLRLVALAFVLLAGASALLAAFGWSLAAGLWPPEAAAFVRETWDASPAALAREVAAFRGGFLAQMPVRAEEALILQTLLLALGGLGARATAMMLLGMALFRWRILTGERPARVYALLGVAGLSIGLPIVELGVQRHEAHGWAVEHSLFLGTQYNVWGSVFVAVGYVGLVLLALRVLGADHVVARPLAAAGRMAFSNYIAQSLVCTTIFYGHGVGLFGTLERTEQLLVVVAVWVAMLVWSPLWLARFHMGPLEWLWRALTYRDAPPFVRARGA